MLCPLQMVEMASAKFVCIVDESKLVSGLGGSKGEGCWGRGLGTSGGAERLEARGGRRRGVAECVDWLAGWPELAAKV